MTGGLLDPGLARCAAVVPRVESHAERIHRMGDAELASALAAARARVAGGASADSVLAESFALTGAAYRRVTGQCATSSQFVAAAALHHGMVADVKDGEGKDLIMLLAAVRDALCGQGVHVAEVNDYLAGRTFEWALPICQRLGITVGLARPSTVWQEHRDAYLADITYGTVHEFACDYLRDNMSWDRDRTVHRDHGCILVNDADSVLLDDGRLPVVIPGPTDEPTWHERCAAIAPALTAGRHYRVDGVTGVISLTDAGTELIRARWGREDLYAPEVSYAVRAAIRAKDRYRAEPCDTLEGKESVLPWVPHTVLARITQRRYVLRYRKIAGLSGSATAVRESFARMYGRDVVEIAPHRPIVRHDHDDRLLLTSADHYDAVLATALERHDSGQPVIIGAATTRAADELVARLTDVGVPVRVARGLEPARDAAVLVAAGRPGAITVSTASAWRGIDIPMDGVIVLGVGRHRSRRTDDRIRWLAGRNGTSGESMFFLSAEELARRDDAGPVPNGEPPFPAGGRSDPEITAAVRAWQEDAERRALRRCAELCGYDDVVDDHCEEFYRSRRRVLAGTDIDALFTALLHDVIDTVMSEHLGGVTQDASSIGQVHDDAMLAYQAHRRYLAEHMRVDDAGIRLLQQRILLSCHDWAWRRHLAAMALLLADVGARRLSHRERLAEFRREAATIFHTMWTTMRRDAVSCFFFLPSPGRHRPSESAAEPAHSRR